MSNVNNYAFANKLQSFKERVLDVQKEKVQKAEKIMHDPNYTWESEEKKKAAQAQYDAYKAWMAFYQSHYDEGMKICAQHERLVDKMSKVYDRWYNEVSNEGKQETEIMSLQADALNEIFAEIYQELKPLGLDIKAPAALNMR